MAPPKCFFKRPEEFYSNVGTMLSPPKLNRYSINGLTSPSPNLKSESSEAPLDLSLKYNEPEAPNILQQLSSFLLEHQQKMACLNQSPPPSQYLTLNRLFAHLPQQMHPVSLRDSNPARYLTPALKPQPVRYRPSASIDPSRLSVDQINFQQHSPNSLPESARDNSSSETSSQYAGTQPIARANKRKNENKVVRPFKLYKGNDSKGVMEALGINEEDEEWLRSIVQYKSVDDVFQFLTNCMSETTKPRDLSDEDVEKIQRKFGHIFKNCNATISNPKMIRHPDMTPVELKTDEYWEKRRKNNDAAKRSREARRHKEDHLNKHCEKLQAENDSLRKEIERIKLRIQEIKRTMY